MAPGRIPSVKSIVGRTRLEDAEALTAAALALAPDTEIRTLVTGEMLRRLPVELTTTR
jgi:hypothetical protein